MSEILRPVQRIVQAVENLEGEGFVVRRPFPTHELDQIDPFLLLDHFGPVDFGPGEAKGAPRHPHAGFEAVTYILEGEHEHQDSLGNRGVLHAGDVQWMTAGRGVVHDEMPSATIREQGGRVHGFQLWVNLPAVDKRMAPRYQDVPSGRIPTGKSKDGKVHVKVIAGEALGAQAVIETRTPILYLHFKLQPGARHVQPLPDGFNAFAYLIAGTGRFGPEGREAEALTAVIFADAPGAATFQAAGDRPLELLLLGGLPLNEPVARYGPFVMNTRHELFEVFEDYHAGKFGTL